MKTSPKKVSDKLQSARDAFDYMVKMSFDKIKSGKKVEAEFIAIAYLPNEKNFSIIPVPLGDTVDADQRREVMDVVGQDLAEQGAEAYVFITMSEVWISEQAGANKKYAKPTLDPRRKEGLIASAQDKNGYVRNVSYQIKRKGGKIEFEKINLFGRSQTKQMYEWTKGDKSKIENSLTIPAWKSYRKAKKELK